jgi:hypothetical protein
MDASSSRSSPNVAPLQAVSLCSTKTHRHDPVAPVAAWCVHGTICSSHRKYGAMGSIHSRVVAGRNPQADIGLVW